MILLQMGGLGFMTMTTLFALVIRKRISLKERLILQEAMNQQNMEGIVRLIRKVVSYSLLIELCGSLLFMIRFSRDMPLGQAIYFGIFHAISLFNNSGFDLFGHYYGLSDYVSDPTVNFVSFALIILGGLGFVVLSDLLDFRRNRKFSLHSKVVLTTSGLLILAGAIVIFLFEYHNPKTLGALGPEGKVFGAFFQSITARTAGVNTLDISSLTQGSLFFIIILMFIGASPGSTGGGIKTTTFMVLIAAVIAMLSGKHEIVLFHYRLARDRIFKALSITLLSLSVVIVVTMLLSVLEGRDFLRLLFEAASAFGTVGLSTGITPTLSDLGKTLLAFTMFAGRLGPLTLAYGLGPRIEKELYRHPEGKVIIG